MDFKAFSAVSERDQTEFAMRIATLLPARVTNKDFGAAYAGSVIFLLGLMAQRYPVPCSDKDMLINQIIGHLQMELKEKVNVEEKRMTFADMVAHAKDELSRGAEDNRTVESIMLELPHILLADPDITGPIRGALERNRAMQKMLSASAGDIEFTNALQVIGKKCLALFPNRTDSIFDKANLDDRRTGAEADGFASTER